jgi:phosphoglycerate dehydrogenase-like enzyme
LNRPNRLPLARPAITTPGLLATPHIGYVTRDLYTTFYRDAMEDIAAFLTPIRVLAASRGSAVLAARQRSQRDHCRRLQQP